MDAKIKRLEEVRAVFRIKKTAMAKLLGIDQSTYFNLLDGRSKLRLAHVERLMKHSPVVNPYWLLTGEQDMFLSPPDLDWSQATSDATVEALYKYVVAQWPPGELSERQKSSLWIACANVINQNPDVRSFKALSVGVRVYLLYIKKYPRLAIPNIHNPEDN